MPALSYYSNVHNTALVILKEKGYRYWYDSETELCCCEKEGWDFFAHDWVQLLGLIQIFEFHQPHEYKEYWWKIDDPKLYPNMPKAKHDYQSVIYKKRT